MRPLAWPGILSLAGNGDQSGCYRASCQLQPTSLGSKRARQLACNQPPDRDPGVPEKPRRETRACEPWCQQDRRSSGMPPEVSVLSRRIEHGYFRHPELSIFPDTSCESHHLTSLFLAAFRRILRSSFRVSHPHSLAKEVPAELSENGKTPSSSREPRSRCRRSPRGLLGGTNQTSSWKGLGRRCGHVHHGSWRFIASATVRDGRRPDGSRG